jgi:hypothetical protein
MYREFPALSDYFTCGAAWHREVIDTNSHNFLFCLNFDKKFIKYRTVFYLLFCTFKNYANLTQISDAILMHEFIA